MSINVVELSNITKSFSGVEVLHNVDLTLMKGEVLGLIGENGAGKSTLMKILSGIYQADSGNISINDNLIKIKNPRSARKYGISLVPQEFNLCNKLSVVENIFLGSEIIKNKVLEESKMRKISKDILSALSINFSVNSQIEDLSAAEKQFVEIAKSIVFDSKILVMDEPTTMLTTKEIENLFFLINKLKNDGMSIIYISHKLDEIKNICNRVIILRDGSLVFDSPVSDITIKDMASKMVGREFNKVFPQKNKVSTKHFFEVRNISSNNNKFTNISFNVFKGEIFGIAGLVGSGRTEIAEAIMGIRKFRGDIFIDGKKLSIKKPADSLQEGLSYLSEDRQASGIITAFNLCENATLSSLKKYSDNIIQKINTETEQSVSESYKYKFSIKAASVYQTLDNLSGGNQQKVLLAKSLDSSPSILIVDEPTRGVDISAKQDIYKFLNELSISGISIILISSELEEILGMCNRTLVLKEGISMGILEESEMSEESIMYLATGVSKGV